MRAQYLAGVLAVAFCANASDWPQHRGPNRDGISTETGLLAVWPAGGPRMVWTSKGAGEGYSSVAIANGRLYTQGRRTDGQFVFAFDAGTGKRIWETRTTARYSSHGNDIGPHGTPTVDGNRLYALAIDGTLVCLIQRPGKPFGRRISSRNSAQKLFPGA